MSELGPLNFKSDDGIPVPESSSEITETWFSETSGLKIRPNSFKLTSDVFNGTGFLSNIDRVECEIEAESEMEGLSSVDTMTRKSFIVKIPPMVTNAFSQSVFNVVKSEKLDQREIFFYQNIYPQLIQIIPDIKKYFANCIYAKVQTTPRYPSVLVLEDLRVQGYAMPTFENGLTEDQLSHAIQFLTKFHFTGRHICLNLPEIYPILKDWHVPSQDPANLRQFESLTWFELGLAVVDRVLTNSSKLSNVEEIKESYAKLVPHSYTILDILVRAGSQFPTLIHDDLWPNNFLVSESGLKILDWQLLTYSDPTYDLAVLILSCLDSAQINARQIEELVEQYYTEYSNLLQCHCSEGIPDRNLEQFLKFFLSYGLGYALVWFSMSCDSIESNPANLAKCVKIFEFLYEMKIPDFIKGELELEVSEAI